MGFMSWIRGWFASREQGQRAGHAEDGGRGRDGEAQEIRIAIAGWREPFEPAEFLRLAGALRSAIAGVGGTDDGHEVSVDYPLDAVVWVSGANVEAVVEAASSVLWASRIVRTARFFTWREFTGAGPDERRVEDLKDSEIKVIDRALINADVPANLPLLELGLRGIELHRSGLYPEALACFNEVLRQTPDHVETLFCRGVLHSTMCNPKKALEDFGRAIELEPCHERALVNRGAEKDEQGDHRGAIDDYRAALELNPGNVMALGNRGNSRHRMGDERGACEDWLKALELGDELVRERLDEYCGGGEISPKGRFRRRGRRHSGMS